MKTHPGGKNVAKRAGGRLLKPTDGTRPQRKHAAHHMIILTPAKAGICALRVKSNIQAGGGPVGSPLQLGIALFELRLLLLVDGGCTPHLPALRQRVGEFPENDARAKKEFAHKLDEIGA